MRENPIVWGGGGGVGWGGGGGGGGGRTRLPNLVGERGGAWGSWWWSATIRLRESPQDRRLGGIENGVERKNYVKWS